MSTMLYFMLNRSPSGNVHGARRFLTRQKSRKIENLLLLLIFKSKAHVHTLLCLTHTLRVPRQGMPLRSLCLEGHGCLSGPAAWTHLSPSLLWPGLLRASWGLLFVHTFWLKPPPRIVLELEFSQWLCTA